MKKRIIIVFVCILLLIIGVVIISCHKLTKQKIISSVKNNNEFGEKYVNALDQYMKPNSDVKMFMSSATIPNKKELNKFLGTRYVKSVFTRPVLDGVYEDDYIVIALKNPPKGYTEWGIYYQKDNKMKGFSDFDLEQENIIDEDHYSYNGRTSKYHDRFRYETERICPNWFFYQEEVW